MDGMSGLSNATTPGKVVIVARAVNVLCIGQALIFQRHIRRMPKEMMTVANIQAELSP